MVVVCLHNFLTSFPFLLCHFKKKKQHRHCPFYIRMADTVTNPHSESGSNCPSMDVERPIGHVTAPPGYTRKEFLLEHARSLFHNMPNWSSNELHRAPEQLTPYLDMLRRTGYPTLNIENLLRVIGY